MKTHEGDVKIDKGSKPKRIRLSEGEKSTLEAMPMLQKGYILMNGGCIIPNVYAKLYCYVNITPHSEVSLYEV